MRVLNKYGHVWMVMLGIVVGCPLFAMAETDEPAPTSPEANGEVVFLAETLTLESRSDCSTIGAIEFGGSGSNRYRGDAFLLDQDALLESFSINLRLTNGQQIDLYFYVHEKLDSGLWQRIWPEDGTEVILNAVGTGAVASYSSGPVLDENSQPLQLLDGRSYALGVAWASSTVTYWYDNVPSNFYPQPFERGQVLGGAAVSLSPPIQDPVNIFVWSGGAYSIEVCFSPDPGACCFLDDSCADDLDATGCLDAGGEFGGPLTLCADTSCPLITWACCLPNGTCNELTQFVCETTEGGVWKENMDCADDPCSPRGACCTDNGCVDDVTATQCTAEPEGFYRGDGTLCTDFPGCNAGGCCFDDQCVIPLSKTSCESQGGVYLGDASLCEETSCMPTGACCMGTQCADGVSEDECVNTLSGTYRGAGTECATITPSCGRGACCTPSAGCVDNILENNCLVQLGGIWQGDSTVCEELPQLCPGQCCWGQPDGANCSENFSPEFCDELPFGTFIGYVDQCTDDPSPCPVDSADQGACCMPNSNCVNSTQSACQSLGGDFSLGMDCSEVPCAQCDEPSDCNDSDPCTTDDCVGGFCVNTPLDCDDSNPCTIDVCSGGNCLYFDVACNDNNACTFDSCDEATGDCMHDPIDCDDTIFCNGMESCVPAIGCIPAEEFPCEPRQVCDEGNEQCLGGGDMDQDGDVDLYDFELFMGCFNIAPIAPECEQGDINDDDVIDLNDFSIMAGDLVGPAA